MMNPLLPPDRCKRLPIECLEQKAKEIASTSAKGTLAAGNSVVLFTLFLLEEILEQLALDPINNLDKITPLANNIANLNISLKIDP